MELLLAKLSVIDGSGAPAFSGSLGIENGRLRVFRGLDAPAARHTVDLTGLTAVPGLIDAHAHGDLLLSSAYATDSKLSQGITTQIAGQCGVSCFPAPAMRPMLLQYIRSLAPYPTVPAQASCADYEAFAAWACTLPCPLDTRCFVGHGTLRLAVMGYAERQPDAAELTRMRVLLRKCIRQGALGLSAGLVYPPGCYAGSDELLSLLRVVHEEGGCFACHPRSESDALVEARAESIRLAREADVPLCLSHMKAAGHDNYGKPRAVIRMMEDAAAHGQKLLMDSYPYLAGNTALNVSIPPRYFSHGLDGLVRALEDPLSRADIRAGILQKGVGYENYIYNCGGFAGVFVSSCPVFHDAEGMRVSDYAARVGCDPFDAYCDILIKNGGLGLALYFHMCQADMLEILSHPLCVVGTDALLGHEGENPHPRAFGSMARAYRLLTAAPSSLSPEAAIRKMSGQTAAFLGLSGKGLLADGYDADIALLDLAQFADRASYESGAVHTAGVRCVLRGGKIVFGGLNA